MPYNVFNKKKVAAAHKRQAKKPAKGYQGGRDEYNTGIGDHARARELAEDASLITAWHPTDYMNTWGLEHAIATGHLRMEAL